MSSRSTSWNAYQEPMSPGIDDTTTSITVADASNLVAPYGYLVLDPDNPSLREYVRVTNVVGNVLTVQRGLDGSAGAGASAHADNAPVRAVSVGQWLDDIFDDIEALEALDPLYLLIDGTRAMAGNLNMDGFQINQVTMAPAPLDDDAVNFKYLTDENLLLLPLDGTRAMTDYIEFPQSAGLLWVDSTNRLFFDNTNTGNFQLIRDDVLRFAITDEAVFIRDENGTTQVSVAADGVTLGSEAFVNVNGAQATPEFSFTISKNTGMFLKAAETIGWAANGFERMSLDQNGLTAGVATAAAYISAAPGVALPQYSFVNAKGIGMYQVGADVLGFVINNTAASVEVSDLWIRLRGDNAAYFPLDQGANTPTTPGHAFRGDPDTGMYRLAANIVGLSAGGIEVFRGSSTQVRLPTIFNNTTSTGSANIVIPGSDGTLFRLLSTLEVKTDLRPLDDALGVIGQLNPIDFKSLLPNDEGRRAIGFGAEEANAVIPYSDLEANNYNDRAILAYAVAAIQELDERTR